MPDFKKYFEQDLINFVNYISLNTQYLFFSKTPGNHETFSKVLQKILQPLILKLTKNILIKVIKWNLFKSCIENTHTRIKEKYY